MRVWVEKTGESGSFVNVPTGSTVNDCINAAQVKYVPGEKIFLNGLDIVNGRKVDLSTVVKDNDTVQVVPNYSGGSEDGVVGFKENLVGRGHDSDICFGYGSAICHEFLNPSLW